MRDARRPASHLRDNECERKSRHFQEDTQDLHDRHTRKLQREKTLGIRAFIQQVIDRIEGIYWFIPSRPHDLIHKNTDAGRLLHAERVRRSGHPSIVAGRE